MAVTLPSLALALSLGTALLASFTAQASTAAQGPSKKFVQLGWDMPSTAYLRDNWRRMEKQPLFDGVIYQIQADTPDDAITTEAFWDRRRWKREWLTGAVEDLRSCRFARLRHNFVRLNATPGDLDWYDDEAWEALAEKAALIAWAVREGGQKGICLDFESYGQPQFQYRPDTVHSFREVAAVARRRGGQFMRAIAAEYPGMVILTLWLNSINLTAAALDDPSVLLAAENQGLLPAFVDGMLDELPPTMTIVDGCETAYRFDGAEAYLRGYNAIRQFDGPAARLVSPENRAKYRGQVQAGFGFYLDAYINPETSPWYIGGHGGSRLARLQQNLSHAREFTDEYVWVYGEKYRWWPASYEEQLSSLGRMWEDAMPGITRAIRWARDPRLAAQNELADRRAAGTLPNLAANPGFEEGVNPDSGLPVGYAAWQDDASHGTFTLDPSVGHNSASSGRISGVLDGCFIQTLAVQPGETYAIEAECLAKGNSVCSLVVRWQDDQGRWACQERDSAASFSPTKSGWAKAFSAVVVPEGASRLVLLLCARNQTRAEDACWFDNVGIWRLD